MTLASLAWAVFAVAVWSEYGWFLLFNAAIPLTGGILWVAVFALAAWGAGRLVAGRFLDADTSSFEAVYLQLLAGTATLALTTGLLAVCRLLRPSLVIGCLGLWACVGGLSLYRRHLNSRVGWGDVPLSWGIVIVAAGGVSLAAATTFAPFYDQWHYHLGFPFQWLREGTVVTFPRQAFSFFPANMGLLYTYALAGPGGWGAQVIHWWMGALAAGGSAAIARRLGAAVEGQFFAAAVFAATPGVVLMGALAGSDLGVAAFAAGCLLLLLRMIQTPESPMPIAICAGLAAGVSAGCKYSALATVVLPLGVMAVVAVAAIGGSVGRLTRVISVGLAFGLGAGIALAPWLSRNFAETGNPVYPYMERVFADGEASARRGDNGVSSGIGTFDFDSSKIETAFTLGAFSRRGRAGDLGTVYLAFSPLMLWWAWRHRKQPEVWATAGYVALAVPAWAAGPPLGRYLFPVLAVVAAFIGGSWSEVRTFWSRPARVVVTALLVVLLCANCNPARDHNLFNQILCFLGAGDSEDYLLENCTQLEPFLAANALLPAEAKVLLVGEPRPFEIDRDVVVEDQFRAPLLVELANQSAAAKDIAESLHEMGVTHIVWNAAEAARIAEAEDRAGYLVCDGDAAQARLDRFLSEYTKPIDSGDWWKIVELSN